MRERTPAAVLLTMAVSGLVVAGCVDNSATTSPSTSASAPTASAGAGAPVASCVTGNWRSTTVTAHAASGNASANLSGGSGVAVTVGSNGETVIDFSKMQPVDFTTKVAGAEVTGKFTFSGQVSATVRTGTGSAGATTSMGPTTSMEPTMGTGPATSASASPAASATPGLATSGSTGPSSTSEMAGTWEPVPPVNWGDTRVTVDLTAPAKVRPVDNIRIADYVGDGASRTGNVVDVEPLLGKGSYQCQGDSLILTPDNGGMGWTLTRA
jgi:hypothetical protein